MPQADWIAAEEAQARLKVRPQTLYAYVSRGLIEARGDGEDSRRSLYRAEDVARLEHRKARGRRPAAIAEDAIAYGEPVLASAITTIERGGLWYRGQDAARLAQSAKLEDVARLLWDCGTQRFPPLSTIVPRTPTGVRTKSCARGWRAVTQIPSPSLDNSHSSATTNAGPAGSRPIATAGPHNTKRVGVSPAPTSRSYAPGPAPTIRTFPNTSA